MAREEKRIDILQAAGRVFYVNGFENTKIEEVAKEAGIGKGTVYEYFESKQQLFEEMIAYTQHITVQDMQKALAQGQSFQDKFKAFAGFMTQTVKEHCQIFDLMISSKIMAREMGAIMLESNVRMGDVLIEVVKEAISKGELRSDLDPELAASIIMGTVNQYCSKKVIFFKKEPDEVDYDKVIDAVMQGIAPQDSLPLYFFK